jgi:hypothetical protein
LVSKAVDSKEVEPTGGRNFVLFGFGFTLPCLSFNRLHERRLLILPNKRMFRRDKPMMDDLRSANMCLDLQKKLNITIGRSTYAYMVPEFSGILELNKVFIDFSSFADNVFGFAGTLLIGVNVLVARSPSHYRSDIQKVKAVFKIELIGLKDIIVISTKGNPSLAVKLSGGDHNGDIAVSLPP